jgi:hypothetical protein
MIVEVAVVTTMRRRRSWSTNCSTPTRDYVGSLLQLYFRCSVRLVVTMMYNPFICKFSECNNRYSVRVAYPALRPACAVDCRWASRIGASQHQDPPPDPPPPPPQHRPPVLARGIHSTTEIQPSLGPAPDCTVTPSTSFDREDHEHGPRRASHGKGPRVGPERGEQAGSCSHPSRSQAPAVTRSVEVDVRWATSVRWERLEIQNLVLWCTNCLCRHPNLISCGTAWSDLAVVDCFPV